MKSSKILFVISLIFMVFMSSCSVPFVGDDISSSGFGSKAEDGSGSKEAKKGIQLEFFENMPPLKINKGTSFGMVLNFVNNGVVPAQDLKVRIFGFETGFVSGIDNEVYQTTKVVPKAGSNGAGTNDEIRLKNIVVDNFDSDSYSFQPTFQICYKYKTDLKGDICVPSSQSYTQTQCEPKEVISPVNNFPVSVKSIKTTAINENEVEFVVDVENVGNGKTLSYENCFDDSPYYTFSTKVNIAEFKLGTLSAECQDANLEESGLVELKNGKGRFICRVQRSSANKAPYNSQLSIVLDYAYQDQFEKKVIVENPSFNR